MQARSWCLPDDDGRIRVGGLAAACRLGTACGLSHRADADTPDWPLLGPLQMGKAEEGDPAGCSIVA